MNSLAPDVCLVHFEFSLCISPITNNMSTCHKKKEIHQPFSLWDDCAWRMDTRTSGTGESSCQESNKMGKRMKCQVENHGPLVKTALGNSSLESPEWLEPFTEGMSEGASSSSTDAVPAEPLPAIPPPTSRLEKPSSNRPGGKRNLFKHSPKDPNCEICRQIMITRGPCN